MAVDGDHHHHHQDRPATSCNLTVDNDSVGIFVYSFVHFMQGLLSLPLLEIQLLLPHFFTEERGKKSLA
jgi:hypothetical protein